MSNITLNTQANSSQICSDLTAANPGDYLTSKVVEEAGSIDSEISAIEGAISALQSKVDAKKKELEALQANNSNSEDFVSSASGNSNNFTNQINLVN